MRWFADGDKEIRSGWKTAVCPHCGHRRPIDKFKMITVKKSVPGGGTQFSYPIEIIKNCDKCIKG
jgi:hypothetical protein